MSNVRLFLLVALLPGYFACAKAPDPVGLDQAQTPDDDDGVGGAGGRRPAGKGGASGASPDEFTFPRSMKAAGYATLHAGKFGNSPKAITGEFDETYDPGNSDVHRDR